MRNRRRATHMARVAARVALVLCWMSVVLSAQGDEAPPRVRASDVLPASALKGAHYQVADSVATPGFFHEFTLTSPHGTFTADGRSQVPVRASEIDERMKVAAAHAIAASIVWTDASTATAQRVTGPWCSTCTPFIAPG